MFFTLSGYLITSILLRSWRAKNNLGLSTFWLRRARRLLPALALVLFAVLLATALFSPSAFHTRGGEALAAGFYVSNWTTILHGISYFSLFRPPGPLDHLWSLAVEEQFYLVWPLLLLAMLRVFQGRIRAVVIATLALAGVSFGLLAVMAHATLDNTRAYEGTDTRAGGLLLGAVLAMVWNLSPKAARIAAGAKVLLDGFGIAALAVILWLLTTTDQYSLSLYYGGILLLSMAMVVVIAVVVHPASFLGRALGVLPFRWIGERSYGIYLWHLPVIAAFPASFLKSTPVLRDVVLVAVIVGLSSLSWSFVEDPIRRLGFRGAFQAAGSWFAQLRTPAIRIGTSAALLTVVAASGVGAVEVLSVRSTTTTTSTVPTPAVVPPTTLHLANVASAPGRTSCKVVTYDGDSTSVSLISTDYLPNPADRINARLFAVGVQSFHNEISGAQSTTETWNGQPNAQQRIAARWASGVRGCWIFALGTNDSANLSFHNGPGAPRIDAMMRLVHGEPVMWLTVKTIIATSPYADVQMQKWNAALVAACKRWPNMRIYDWRSEVQNGWYISDGIHFSSLGSQQRSKRIAAALTRAFPQGSAPSTSCLVSSGIPG
jgi:peptidoglycan/LPS O-acetylase OafA/YrhL